MKGKLLFIAGGAVGYVLGARAGRKRYEQIKSAAMKVWETDGVQKQVHTAEDYMADKLGEVPGALVDGAKKAVSAVVKKAGDKGDSGTGKTGSGKSRSSGKGSASGSDASGDTEKVVTIETSAAGDATVSSGSTKSRGK